MDYKKLVQEAILYHKDNGLSCKIWDNFISTTSMVISSLAALTMTVLTVQNSSAGIVTIVGAIYAFTITVLNKFKDSYSFLALSYQHFHMQDQYAELLLEFENCYEEQDSFETRYNMLCNKYILITQKSHIQSVYSCKYFMCCFKRGHS